MIFSDQSAQNNQMHSAVQAYLNNLFNILFSVYNINIWFTCQKSAFYFYLLGFAAHYWFE